MHRRQEASWEPRSFTGARLFCAPRCPSRGHLGAKPGPEGATRLRSDAILEPLGWENALWLRRTSISTRR
jgi:hypothetical protein